MFGHDVLGMYCFDKFGKIPHSLVLAALSDDMIDQVKNGEGVPEWEDIVKINYPDGQMCFLYFETVESIDKLIDVLNDLKGVMNESK